MRIYRELTIKGNVDETINTISKIVAESETGWRRDEEAEKQIRGDGKYFCFSCSQTDMHPDALFWLLERSNDELYVPNIIPISRGKLSYDEYNSIIEDFVIQFLSDLSDKRRLEFTMTDGDVDLDHWLSGESIHLLKSFSGAANKSTGSSHPCDRERWLEFIFSVHKRREKLSPDELRRWFYEEEHWSEDIAFELMIEYERAIEILDAYDKYRGSGQ